MEQKKENKNSPIARRKFLRVLGTAVAGGSILAVSGVLASRLKNEKEAINLFIKHPPFLAQNTVKVAAALSYPQL